MIAPLTIKMSVFNNPNVVNTILKVLNGAELPVKKVYALKNFLEKYIKENAKYEEIRLEALKKANTKKDKDGNLLSGKDGNAIFKTKEDEAKYTKYYQELLNVEVAFEGAPDLSLDDLGDIKLKGNELLALQMVFPKLDPEGLARKEEVVAKIENSAAS